MLSTSGLHSFAKELWGPFGFREGPRNREPGVGTFSWQELFIALVTKIETGHRDGTRGIRSCATSYSLCS